MPHRRTYEEWLRQYEGLSQHTLWVCDVEVGSYKFELMKFITSDELQAYFDAEPDKELFLRKTLGDCMCAAKGKANPAVLVSELREQFHLPNPHPLSIDTILHGQSRKEKAHD